MGPPHAPPSRPVPGRPAAHRPRRVDRGPGTGGRPLRPCRRVLASPLDIRRLRRLEHLEHARRAHPRRAPARRPRDVPLARPRVLVQPTPGHTRGSVTYLAEVDGLACAFTGDLIAAPGRVDTIHDLQWQYGMPDAVGAALHSVTLLAAKELGPAPAVARPPDRRPGTALRLLATNLAELYDLMSEMRRNRVWLRWPHAVDQPKTPDPAAPLGEHALAREHVRARRRRRARPPARLRLPLLGPLLRGQAVRRALARGAVRARGDRDVRCGRAEPLPRRPPRRRALAPVAPRDAGMDPRELRGHGRAAVGLEAAVSARRAHPRRPRARRSARR